MGREESQGSIGASVIAVLAVAFMLGALYLPLLAP